MQARAPRDLRGRCSVRAVAARAFQTDPTCAGSGLGLRERGTVWPRARVGPLCGRLTGLPRLQVLWYNIRMSKNRRDH